jgi:hypothetical protein
MELGDQRNPHADLQLGNRIGTHCIGGWVSTRAGVDGCGNSRLAGVRLPEGTALIGSLYRLSYPGPQYHGPSTHSF